MFQLVATRTLQRPVRTLATFNFSSTCTFRTCAIRGTGVVTSAEESPPTLHSHVLGHTTRPQESEEDVNITSPRNTSDDAAANPATLRQIIRKERKLRRIATGLYKPLRFKDPVAKEEGTQNGSIDQKAIANSVDKVTEHTKRTRPVPNVKPHRPEAPSGRALRSTTKRKETPPKREAWQDHKTALNEKFGDIGWQPRKRLSPDTLEGIRSLHASDPGLYSTQVLSQHFKISPEAIRRILKSKWRPDEEEVEDRRQRWENRGIQKWQEMASQGVRPPKKWRTLGVQTPPRSEMPKKPRARTVKWDKVVSNGQGAESLAPRLL